MTAIRRVHLDAVHALARVVVEPKYCSASDEHDDITIAKPDLHYTSPIPRLEEAHVGAGVNAPQACRAIEGILHLLI